MGVIYIILVCYCFYILFKYGDALEKKDIKSHKGVIFLSTIALGFCLSLESGDMLQFLVSLSLTVVLITTYLNI